MTLTCVFHTLHRRLTKYQTFFTQNAATSIFRHTSSVSPLQLPPESIYATKPDIPHQASSTSLNHTSHLDPVLTYPECATQYTGPLRPCGCPRRLPTLMSQSVRLPSDTCSLLLRILTSDLHALLHPNPSHSESTIRPPVRSQAVPEHHTETHRGFSQPPIVVARVMYSLLVNESRYVDPKLLRSRLRFRMS